LRLPGLREQAVGHVALDHHRPVGELAAQVEQRAQERRGDRVGQVRDHARSGALAHQRGPVERERVGVHELRVRGQERLRAQRAHEARVDLDREHLSVRAARARA
jgi:hypothetical protein